MRRGLAGSRRMQGTALGLALAVMVPLVATACQRTLAEPITRTTLSVLDDTRSTPARGDQPELPYRHFPISITMPTTPGPWPLIVFAHGFDTTPADYQSLLDYWAAGGYVVAAPTFPIASSDGSGPARRDDNYDEPWDISATIDVVLADPGLGPDIDASKIGVAGHSDGGSAVEAMALNDLVYDHRVTTFLPMSGAIMIGGPYASAPGGTWTPFLNQGALMAVSGDADPNYPWAMYMSYWAAGPKGNLTILGGSHFDPFVDPGPMGDAVRYSTLDFFNHWLRGDPGAGYWLHKDGNQPGLTRLDTGPGAGL